MGKKINNKKMRSGRYSSKAIAFTLIVAMLLSMTGFGAGLPGIGGSNQVYASGEDIQVEVRIEGYDATFLPTTSVTVSSGATAWDAIHQVALANSIEILKNEGYISSVSKGGIVLKGNDSRFTPQNQNLYNMSGWIYRMNDQSTGSIGVDQKEIKTGDLITLSYGAYGDYGFFENSEYFGVEKAPLDIKLKKDVWGTRETVSDASIYGYRDNGEIRTLLGTTDGLGVVSLTFNAPGTYELTGEKVLVGYLSDGGINTITRPYTKVTIISAAEMEEKIDADASSLTLSYNGTDSVVTLPTKGLSGASIEWTSGDPSVISHTGTVKRPVCGTPDALVTMTAIIGNAEYNKEKKIVLNVSHYTEAEVINALDGIQSWELPSSSIQTSKIWLATMSQDNQIKFIWKSSNPEVIGETQGTWGDLAVIQPDFGEAGIPVLLTVSAISGNIQKDRGIQVVVQPVDNNGKILEINTLINGIVADVHSNHVITGHMSYGSEWVQAMVSSGNGDKISEVDKSNYLAMALEEAQSNRTNLGKIGKLIVGLTALGIDPRTLPGKDGGAQLDLINKIYTSGAALGFGDQYTIPYVLMAYNLNYSPEGIDREQVINQTINKMADIEGGTIDNPIFYNAWSADSIGIFSAVLAPYYTSNTTAQGIVNRGITWLEDNQNAGTFGNANSDAMVVLGLAPLMTHSAIKNASEELLTTIGNSLLDYKTTDNKGFESWGTYNLLATVQGFQGITAYKNFLTEGGIGANIFDYPTTNLNKTPTWPTEKFPMDIAVTPPTNTTFNKGGYVDTSALDYKVTATYLDGSTAVIPNSLCSVSYIDTATTGAKEVRVTYLGKTKTFTVLVKDATTQPVTKQITITIRGTGVTNLKVTINSNSSVLSVLEEICAVEKIDLLSYKGYVSSMDGKEEFGQGPNSGWLYQVDGNTPSTTGASQYKLKGGENLVWYYTTDFTKDASSSAWVNGNGTATGSGITSSGITGGGITGGGILVTFKDITGHWAQEYIEYLAGYGIIKGKGEGLFMPNDPITRAEFVTLLANKAGVDFGGYRASVFGDVKESDWFAGAVTWASENKIVTGEGGMFRPNDQISRQEMAVMLDRYMTKVEKSDTTGVNGAILFSDEAEIAAYAKASVIKMQQFGIINGKTSSLFAPEDQATRGEAAKMLATLLKADL